MLDSRDILSPEIGLHTEDMALCLCRNSSARLALVNLLYRKISADCKRLEAQGI